MSKSLKDVLTGRGVTFKRYVGTGAGVSTPFTVTGVLKTDDVIDAWTENAGVTEASLANIQINADDTVESTVDTTGKNVVVLVGRTNNRL